MIVGDVVDGEVHFSLESLRQGKQLQKYLEAGVVPEEELTAGYARSLKYFAKVIAAQSGFKPDTLHLSGYSKIQGRRP
jgi:hypothetical protein